MKPQLLRTKPVTALLAETQAEGHRLKKALNAWDLTAIGIGCIIGVGIFVLPGVEAAKHAGPGIILSFAVAASACACSALCYAELAAMIPVSGSAYTYGYATLGEIFAWIIGWDLVLEYMVGASLVAIGWSAYLINLLNGVGIALPHAITASPFAETPGIVDLPAALIVLLISYLLVRGIKESSRVNLVVVIIKVSVILAFIVLTARYVKPENWTPLSMKISGECRVPFTRAGTYSSMDCAARTLPRRLPPLMIAVPTRISASMSAPSPTIRTSSLWISPWNLPSMRTRPSKCSLPSKLVPRPSSAVISVDGSVGSMRQTL